MYRKSIVQTICCAHSRCNTNNEWLFVRLSENNSLIKTIFAFKAKIDSSPNGNMSNYNLQDMCKGDFMYSYLILFNKLNWEE